jgi:hypothetical protein
MYIDNKTINNKLLLKKEYLNKLNISSNLLISRDDFIIELLHNAIFIKYKAPTFYNKMISNIEDFLVTFETLKQNVTNIYLDSKQMIQPVSLSKDQQHILINDIRDQLERVMTHIETIIHVIPNENIYLESYYNFYQLLRNQLSRYYNRILSMYKIYDHTSQYQLLRTSEKKYDFIDNI